MQIGEEDRVAGVEERAAKWQFVNQQ